MAEQAHVEWVSLFEFRSGTLGVYFSPYAVTANGKRFLINTVVEMEPNAPLTVVANWAAGVKNDSGHWHAARAL
jgi:hypothetical protein